MENNKKMNLLIAMEKTFAKAKSIEGKTFHNDKFLADVIDFLSRKIESNFMLSDHDLEKICLLGRAAVRTYQSFDYFEIADGFVESACELSEIASKVDN